MENNAQNLKEYRINVLNAKIEKESLEFERDVINQIKKAIENNPTFIRFYLKFNNDDTRNKYYIDDMEDLVVSMYSNYYKNLNIKKVTSILKSNDFLKSHNIVLQSNEEYIYIEEQ